MASEMSYWAMEHQLLNMHFEVTGDEATGIGLMRFVGIADETKPGEMISPGGSYDWDFVREQDGWKIRKVKLGVWWPQGEDSIDAFR